jgi:hypothetical protein
LLAAADAALYRAKQDGRDRVCVITEKATFSGSPKTSASSLPVALVPGQSGVAAPGPTGSHS